MAGEWASARLTRCGRTGAAYLEDRRACHRCGRDCDQQPDDAPEEASESKNVIVAVCPTRSVALLLLIVTEGATVSTEIGGFRLPAELLFPTASVNVAAATETVPLAVELGEGVKVAV